VVLAGVGLVGLLLGSADIPGHRRDADAASRQGIHKIRHVVIIMQENRSFDSYFGTYPGADGIPGLAGHPGTVPCVPDPGTNTCVKPYHDTSDRNAGGPHANKDAIADINGGKMDGFQAQARKGRFLACHHTDNPGCSLAPRNPDVMGYHDWHEIPNYWNYARNFVLQDHMFQADNSWSLPSHLSLVSGWAASCAKHNDPMSCKSALNAPWGATSRPGQVDFPWTDLTYLLHRYHVSWRYYVANGNQPDCSNNKMFCPRVHQGTLTESEWNPLPRFDDVWQDHQIGNIQPVGDFYRAAHRGTLPAVAWIAPNQANSEHPPSLVTTGQSYVTHLIDSIMRGPDWKSTAIFVSWDDWGGFYDHLKPSVVDHNGYGIRVPALVISPYAKQGYVDHQVLSSDAYLKFIEGDFLHGARLNPHTDGRPDSRPNVRENARILGNLVNDFDFSQKPRPPVLLPLHPPFS
jgi:phospholipase C